MPHLPCKSNLEGCLGVAECSEFAFKRHKSKDCQVCARLKQIKRCKDYYYRVEHKQTLTVHCGIEGCNETRTIGINNKKPLQLCEKHHAEYLRKQKRGYARKHSQRRLDANKKNVPFHPPKTKRKCVICGKDPYPNWWYCPACHGEVDEGPEEYPVNL